ncbi:hypothetical protein KAT36_00955 [Candidatus Pacearchaeota archaeon]|nr:hypothetical protein [Candidatus Pacearchaeota archaeon]
MKYETSVVDDTLTNLKQKSVGADPRWLDTAGFDLCRKKIREVEDGLRRS